MILARGSVLGVSDFELPTLGCERVRLSGGGPPADERKQIEEALASQPGPGVPVTQGAAEALRRPRQRPGVAHPPLPRIDKLEFRRRVACRRSAGTLTSVA